MKYTQKKNNNVCEFTFNKNSLDFAFKDKVTEYAFETDYDDIAFDFVKIKEKNQWFRNAGALWLIIGTCASFSGEEFQLSFWFLLGVGCLAYYFIKQAVLITFDTPKGKIFVIEDKKCSEILNLISEKRKAQFRDRYGAINFSNRPETELNRFQWMRDKDIISKEEFIQIKGQICKAIEDTEDPVYE